MVETAIARLKRILRDKAAQAPAAMTIDQRRQTMESIAFKVANDITVETLTVAQRDAEWLRAPGIRDDRAVLYLHGGGYVMGSPNTHRSLAGEISRAAQAAVLLIDYRLAPEYPFPAAVEDGVAAWRWLLDQGFAPARTAIAGDSAGDGLTVATLPSARDQELPMPAAAVSMSPWSDLT